MKPAFSYYGGKQRMVHHIIPLIPKHTVYVEPFAGGLAALFAKPLPRVDNNQYYREVINDTNSDVVNFYRQLRDNGEDLARLCELTPYSQDEHRLARERCDDVSDIEKARRFYVSIQQSFGNKLDSGWGTGVFGKNNADTFYRASLRLRDVAARFANVYIAHEDALRVITRWDSPQTFFYCDPPYPGTDQGHYSGYTVDDFAALVDTLDKCEGSFLLSNYDQPDVAIPDDWERLEFDAVMSAAKNTWQTAESRQRTEVIWRRQHRGELRPEIARLYASGRYDCFTGDDSTTRQISLFDI